MLQNPFIVGALAGLVAAASGCTLATLRNRYIHHKVQTDDEYYYYYYKLRQEEREREDQQSVAAAVVAAKRSGNNNNNSSSSPVASLSAASASDAVIVRAVRGDRIDEEHDAMRIDANSGDTGTEVTQAKLDQLETEQKIERIKVKVINTVKDVVHNLRDSMHDVEREELLLAGFGFANNLSFTVFASITSGLIAASYKNTSSNLASVKTVAICATSSFLTAIYLNY